MTLADTTAVAIASALYRVLRGADAFELEMRHIRYGATLEGDDRWVVSPTPIAAFIIDAGPKDGDDEIVVPRPSGLLTFTLSKCDARVLAISGSR